MNEIKKHKLSAAIHNLSAEFFVKQQDLVGVTVTQTNTSQDGKTVFVFVRVPNAQMSLYSQSAPKLQKQLRAYIANYSKLRYCPQIVLKIDNSAEATAKIEELIS